MESVWLLVTDYQSASSALKTQALLALGAMARRVRPSNQELATRIVVDLHHLLEEHTGAYIPSVMLLTCAFSLYYMHLLTYCFLLAHSLFIICTFLLIASYLRILSLLYAPSYLRILSLLYTFSYLSIILTVYAPCIGYSAPHSLHKHRRSTIPTLPSSSLPHSSLHALLLDSLANAGADVSFPTLKHHMTLGDLSVKHAALRAMKSFDTDEVRQPPILSKEISQFSSRCGFRVLKLFCLSLSLAPPTTPHW